MRDDVTRSSWPAIQLCWEAFWLKAYEWNRLNNEYQSTWSMYITDDEVMGRTYKVDGLLKQIDIVKPEYFKLKADLTAMLACAAERGQFPDGIISHALALLPKDSLQIKVF